MCENNASCLEWLTCLVLFIMVEFEKLLYSPDLKMVLFFLVTKVFQKGTMFMRCYGTKWSATMWWPQCVQTSSPRKNRLRKPS